MADELIINLGDDFRVNVPSGAEEAVINFSDDILVKVRNGSDVAVSLTSQGVQGPPGEIGDVTPAAIAARDTAIAAMDAAQDALADTEIAAAAADADAAAAQQSFNDVTAAIVALGLPATHQTASFLRRNATNTAIEYRTATQVRADIAAAASVHAHVIADITGLQAAIDSKGPKALGPNNLLQGQATFQALYANSTDTGWKKVADITIGTGLYQAAAFEFELRDYKDNKGGSSAVEPMLFYVAAYRSAGVQDDNNNGTVRGPVADILRLVKVSTGVYEIQIRQRAAWHYVQVEGRALAAGSAVTYTWATAGNVAGNEGTAYLATPGFGYMTAADRTKLDGIATNANNYAHPTGDGNLHVPATGTTNNNKVLRAGATAGSMSWQTIVKADVGLGNVDNTSDANKPISTAQQAALDLKAPLASPALTGTPTAPTAATGTNTTQIATTAYVKAAIDALLEGAPGALDTLNELAAALGDDPNFATTMTNSIAEKLAIADFTSAAILTKLLLVHGAGSGLDADLLDGQHGAFYRNASNLDAGTINDARLSVRLGADAATVTDWNAAITNGFYTGSDAANAPAAGWWLGIVESRGENNQTQTVHQFTSDGSADTKTWRRSRDNGVWGAWYKLQISQAEQDARYAKLTDVPAATVRATPAAGTSLNTVLTAGTYFFDTPADITTALNFPSDSRTGRLIVDKNGIGDQLYQEYRDDNANNVWIRWSANSGASWSNWNNFLTNATYSVVSQANAEAGTSTVVSMWTAQRVRQAIAAYSHPKGMLSGGDQVVYTATGNIAAADNGKVIIADSATAITLTLPAAATLGEKFFAIVYNLGAGDLTLNIAAAGVFDDTTADVTLETGHSLVITGNGTTIRKLLRGGGAGGGGSVIPLRETIAGNGGAVYALTNTPASEDAMLVFVGGAVQGKARFTLAGNQITFDGNVAVGENIEVMLLKGGASVVGVAPLYKKHAGTGSAGPFTLQAAPAVAEALTIHWNGLAQPKDGSAYTLVGDQITFSEAIPVDTYWEETILQAVGIGVPNPESVGATEIKASDVAAILAKLGLSTPLASALLYRGDIGNAGTDISTILAPGIWSKHSSANATTALGFPVALAGILIVTNNTNPGEPSSGYLEQRFCTYGTPNRSFVRRRAGATWGAWVEEYNSGSILGPVSQSAGIPTGAIIERGSNANGEYVRFADGTQICWRTVTLSGTAWGALGNIFSSSTLTGSYISVPVAFVAAPTVTAVGTDNGKTSWPAQLEQPGSSHFGTFCFKSHVSGGASGYLHLVATGRWF